MVLDELQAGVESTSAREGNVMRFGGRVVFRFYLPICLTLMLAAGCIVTPTPAKHRVRGQPTADASPFLTPGKTTREEIQTAFGPPTAVWEEARVWIYVWDESDSGWLWLVAGGYTAGGGYERVWKERITLLRFDGQGILVDIAVEDRPELEHIGQRVTDWVYGEGCMSPFPPRTVPVLMRVVTNSGEEIDRWETGLNLYISWRSVIDDRFGGFRTGGLVREKRKREKIPKKYRAEGWVLLNMEPGYNYISLWPKKPDYLNYENMTAQLVLQIQAPAGNVPTYIGSFHFQRDQTGKPSFWNMGSGTWTDYHFEGITDDRDLALQVVDEILPGYPGLVTHLAAIKPGPRIINSPHFRWLSGIYRSTNSEN